MNYIKTIYGNKKETDYPILLTQHLIQNYYKPTEQEPKLLDIGAGSETYLKEFFQQGMLTYGIDLENNILPTLFSQMNILPCDLETDKIPFVDNYFDYIFCKSTIEHVTNTHNLLTEAYRVLKPQGKILILVPSWEHNYKWFFDDPTHIKPFCRKGLQDALKMARFQKVTVNYFYHLPYTWKCQWLKVVPKLIALLPNGLRWKNKEETIARIWVRFSKELQLIGISTKKTM